MSTDAPKKINDGGQAFPRAGYDGPDRRDEGDLGMSLRDYFAGQAMASLLLSADIAFAFGKRDESATLEETAWDAYCYADAMLKAREVAP